MREFRAFFLLVEPEDEDEFRDRLHGLVEDQPGAYLVEAGTPENINMWWNPQEPLSLTERILEDAADKDTGCQHEWKTEGQVFGKKEVRCKKCGRPEVHDAEDPDAS